jgi:hypothetical protein
VCVVNKKKARCDLYEADGGGSIFALEMRKVNEAGALDGGVGDDVTGAERREMLIDAFGSRKKKKMEVTRKANIVDVRAIASAGDVAASIVDIGFGAGASGSSTEPIVLASRDAARTEESAAAVRRIMLPPFNEFAAAPEDVYVFDKMLSSASRGALEPLARSIVAEAMRTIEGNVHADEESCHAALAALVERAAGSSRFVATALSAALSLPASAVRSSERRRLVVCLLYLSHMLAIHDAPERLRARARDDGTVSVSKAIDAAPPALAGALLNAFFDVTDASGVVASNVDALPDTPAAGFNYNRSAARTAKLRCHIICAALVASGIGKSGGSITCELDVLGLDLKLPARQMAFYARELGATVAPSKSSLPGSLDGSATSAEARLQATLRVPLVFPKPKSGPRAK